MNAVNRIGENFDLGPATINATGRTITFHGNSLADEDVESILSYVVGKFSNEGVKDFDAGAADQSLEAHDRRGAEQGRRHARSHSPASHQPAFPADRPHAGSSPHHYEVLLRFEDGRSPFADVMFAEEINIVHELDLAVTHGAVAKIQEAAKKGQKLRLAVNMSARSLLNDTFLGMFEQLASSMGSARKQLIIEITESAKLEDLPKASRAVDRLRGAGHYVCLDDFGAGPRPCPICSNCRSISSRSTAPIFAASRNPRASVPSSRAC